MIDEILLRRKNKLVMPLNSCTPKTERKDSMVMAILKNIEEYGYTLSVDVVEIIRYWTENEIKEFYEELVGYLKTYCGADKTYRCMYPNFPNQVYEMSDAELLIKAFIHYVSGGTIYPFCEKDKRFPLIDKTDIVVLELGSAEGVTALFKNLCTAKTSLSQQDKVDIAEMLKNYSHLIYAVSSKDFQFKENAVYFAFLYWSINKNDVAESELFCQVSKYIKTATDILRFCVALSDGDISLAKNTRFKKFSNKERRLIMNLLEKVSNSPSFKEDMWKYCEQWKRIGEIIHPFSLSHKKYPKTITIFFNIRNHIKPLFDAGLVEEAIKHHDVKAAVEILKNKPSEFARRLDKLLRISTKEYCKYIIDNFKEVANDIPSRVLYQVIGHFLERFKGLPQYRIFFPKGQLAKAKVIPNELDKIDGYCIREILKVCREAIMNQYASRSPMGKVYIDAEMKNYLLPFSQRSASSIKKIVTRGSSFPAKNDTKIIRPFIWWTNLEDGTRVDVDLSMVGYDENWSYCSHISYTNLKGNGLACHSGDITNGGEYDDEGVSEFIDVNPAEALKRGIRYLVFQIYNYTCIHFSQMGNCRFGWMERENADMGEIFEPKTVQMNFNLTANSQATIPVIFDCKERKFIWCDICGCAKTFCGSNNLESNLVGNTLLCYGITNMCKIDMYNAILVNAEARGKRVDNPEEADIIFSNTIKGNGNQKVITAFDIDYFMSEII